MTIIQSLTTKVTEVIFLFSDLVLSIEGVETIFCFPDFPSYVSSFDIKALAETWEVGENLSNFDLKVYKV